MLCILVTGETVLRAEHLAAVGVAAQVGARAVQLLVLLQVILAHERLAAVGKLADEATAGVDVLVRLEVWLLSEALATVHPIAHVRLLQRRAARAVRGGRIRLDLLRLRRLALGDVGQRHVCVLDRQAECCGTREREREKKGTC